MMDQHRIRLIGDGAHSDRISGRLARDLLALLVEGSEQTLRFRIDGRSSVQGPPPKWLKPAADFLLLPSGDASSFVVQSSPLLDTMKDRFQQGVLFSDLDASESPIALFEDAIEDAAAGREDSDRFDADLVRTLERFGKLLDQGIDRIEFMNGRLVTVDRAALAQFERIEQTAPPTQRVRVAGTLEAIQYSDCRFKLILADGGVLAGTAVALGHEALKAFFGLRVVLVGTAAFRRSGAPLRLEAEALELATDRDVQMWSVAPKPLLTAQSMRELRVEQTRKQGLAKILGTWPGDETEEQIRLALEQRS